MLKKTLRALATLAAIAAAPAAWACPDWQGRPHFGQIDLSAGFTPDPFVRNVTAGGTINVQRCFSGGFSGFVTTRPDFDIYWNGGTQRFTIAIESNADAILLVNAPDGSWHYSDDYRGTNPAITFFNPQDGLYDVWIGSYDGSRRNPARLIVTEFNY